MSVKNSQIEYSFENLDNGLGSKIKAKAIYEACISYHLNTVSLNDVPEYLFKALKRDIDNDIAEYSRENQVSDGYITIPIKEYNELKDFWMSNKNRQKFIFVDDTREWDGND